MNRPFRTTRPANLQQQGRLGWYRISNQAAGPVQVTIYDEIGFLGVSADSFMRDLAQVPGDIEMHINSPGGDVFDGIAIYNQLRQRPGVVAVVVDGLAASAASFIAQAASPGRLAMAPHSQMMIHDGFGMSIGNAGDMRQMADLLDKASDNIAAIYADRSGKPAGHWRALMQNETWLSDAEAVAEGLADHVLGQERPQASWDLSVYDHPRNASGWVTRDGKRVFDPDGDGDDDSTAAGDSDHDYWSEDGQQLKPVPPDPETGNGGQPLAPGNHWHAHISNADKYSADDLKRLASEGKAMKNPDGSISYPIDDAEDLDNAIHAVGRGNAGHDAIRRHIIKRAAALGASDAIPDNWSSDGSLKSGSADNLSAAEILALFRGESVQLAAGKE